MSREIKLTRGFVAIIDDDAYERVSKFKWFAHKGYSGFYAVRNVTTNGIKRAIYMQNFIYGEVPDGMLVDHRNGNPLDNHISNLRLLTKAQNRINAKKTKNISGTKTTSKYNGVCWHKNNKKWQAQIKVDYKIKYLGSFDNEEEAAKAYNTAALHYFRVGVL